jgi:hypothetical protein
VEKVGGGVQERREAVKWELEDYQERSQCVAIGADNGYRILRPLHAGAG